MSKTTRTIPCPTCQGTGDSPTSDTPAACPSCLGMGHVERQDTCWRVRDAEGTVKGVWATREAAEAFAQQFGYVADDHGTCPDVPA